MLPSEKLVAAFENTFSETMPWFADLTYWCSSHIAMGDFPEKYIGDGRLDLYRELGCGAHEELYGPVASVRHSQVDTRVHEVREQDGSATTYTTFQTPIGSITKTDRSSVVSYSKATLEYPVKTEEDLKVLRFIIRDQDIKPNSEAYANQTRLMKLWDGWGIVSSLPPRTPLLRLIVEWAGFMNVVRLHWRAREAFDETIELMYESDDPIYESICEAPARFVYFGENLSSDLISPNLFSLYLNPYYKKRSSQLHAKGKSIFLHIDGGMRGLLPLLSGAGIDCAQSLTPAPFGDLKIQDLRRAGGDDIVLWGGLAGVLFSKIYSPQLLRSAVQDVMDTYIDDRRFIIGVSDQVPPDGEIERVKTVSEAIEARRRS